MDTRPLPFKGIRIDRKTQGFFLLVRIEASSENAGGPQQQNNKQINNTQQKLEKRQNHELKYIYYIYIYKLYISINHKSLKCMKIVKFYSCCHFEDVCIYCLACFRYYLFVLALGLEVDMGELRKEAHIEIVDEQKSCR